MIADPDPQISLTVALPTHCPRPLPLEKVLDALARQTLPKQRWELLLIDSASTPRLTKEVLNQELLPNSTLLQESMPGLTRARTYAICRSRGNLILFVDDDNVLAPDYLEQALHFASKNPDVLLFGGKSIPDYEAPPPPWIADFEQMLAVRDLGEEVVVSRIGPENEYPAAAPIGAGMIIRQQCAMDYVRSLQQPSNHFISDRVGSRLTSGGDNDMVLFALQSGGAVAYTPTLSLHHIIPASRTTSEYLAKMNYSSSRSYVQVLHKYNISPWPACSRLHAFLGKLRSLYRFSPWKNKKQHILWRGACGLFDGRADVGTIGVQSISQTIGLGRALYHLYHRPRRWLQEVRAKGIRSYVTLQRCEAEMMRSAYLLREPDKLDDNSITVHFLTGKAYLEQTFFCAHSLEVFSKRRVAPVIYDDGSLVSRQLEALQKRFPEATVRDSSEILSRLDEALPTSRFPSLRNRRLIYPHLRKITDIHAGTDGWKLVLDSDMLFFKHPAKLLEWIDSPDEPLCMQDVMNSYGHSFALMEHLTGHPIPTRVNVGVCGLASDQIDWEQLEYWCKRTLEMEGPQYTQEQAFVAMMFSIQNFQMLSADDYIVLPDETQVLKQQGVMHHYVAESKQWYFTHAWKDFLNR